MCGIAGLIGYGDEELVRRMTESLVHRGPDGAGFYADSARQLFLGHRRLSVLDLTGGAQPMWDVERRVAVVFNGEIYNHRELRRQLQGHGHVFTTDHSDTEVLVHGYKQWGHQLPNHLDGMFAFAVYDVANAGVFLARDRFGEKPLFVHRRHEGIAFASELSALCVPGVAASLKIDKVSIAKFFAYCLFPGRATPFLSIEKLPPGHSLWYVVAEQRAESGPYWTYRIDPLPVAVTEQKLQAWSEELRGLLMRSVAERLEADVPVGIFLSGGVDSSAVLACAASAVERSRIKAFSVGFREPSYDESRYARAMAAHVGCDLRLDMCTLDTAASGLSALLSDIAEPVGDPSILPTHLLCKFARQEVTVALSGDGSDELFFGYAPFQALPWATRYAQWMPRWLHRALLLGVGYLPTSDRYLGWDFKLKRTLRGLSTDPALWAPGWMGALALPDLERLFDMRLDREEIYGDAMALWRDCLSEDPRDRLAEFFTRFYLPDGVLTKTDRSSMRVSLEVRTPFLATDIVDFARRLPADAKFHGGSGKRILKLAFAPLLPDEVLSRRKKGFGIPLNRWMRNFAAPAMSPQIGLDKEYVAHIWQRQHARRGDYSHALFCILSLQETIGRQLASLRSPLST